MRRRKIGVGKRKNREHQRTRYKRDKSGKGDKRDRNHNNHMIVHHCWINLINESYEIHMFSFKSDNFEKWKGLRISEGPFTESTRMSSF